MEFNFGKLCAVFVLFVAITTEVGSNEEHRITKRYLLFPRYSVFQFSWGLSSPLILPKRSINLSAVLQVNYNYPWNESNFMPMTVSARRGSFDLSRTVLYEHIIGILDSFDYEGEECLLRTICEISEIPMHLEGKFNLLETIVHYIFTPSVDLSRESPIISRNASLCFNDKLLLAEDLGKSNANCRKVYNKCKTPLIDLFTSKYIIS